MTKQELFGIWYYYLTLEDDLSNTSRYIEPAGQENVYSFEFAKILILACTEIESVFKSICYTIKGTSVAGNIGTYKEIILSKYPKITSASVVITRLGNKVAPFSEWNEGKLSWWDAYQKVKHNRGSGFQFATYKNASMAIAALYISIFYLSKISNIPFQDNLNHYIISNYSHQAVSAGPRRNLPDFEDSTP